MMKRHLSAIFLALALTLSLAACQGQNDPPPSQSPGGEEPPPVSSQPEPEPQQSAPGPVPEDGGKSQLLTVREYTPASCYRVADVHGDRVLLWNGDTAEFLANIREMDLATGEETSLFCSWLGQAQTDGTYYYWVSLSDTPTANGEYFPEGIRKKEKRIGGGTGDLVYQLPRNSQQWNNPIPNYPWNGEPRFITDLCLGEGGYLAWVESWLMETGEFKGWYAYEVYTMRPGDTEPHLYVEAAKRNNHVRQLWIHDRYLIISTTPEDYPGTLLVYDLEERGQLLDVDVRCPTSADYDGRRLVWSGTGDGHTFYLHDPAAGETREVDVLFENTVEMAGSVALLGGRYVLYDVDTSLEGGFLTKGVRLYDLEAGEVVYRSYEDDNLQRKAQTPEASPLVVSRDGKTAAMLNGREGPDKSWLWVFDF